MEREELMIEPAVAYSERSIIKEFLDSPQSSSRLDIDPILGIFDLY